MEEKEEVSKDESDSENLTDDADKDDTDVNDDTDVKGVTHHSDGDQSEGEISVDKNGWRLRRQKYGRQKRRRKRRRKFFGRTRREWCRFLTEWLIFYTTFFFVLLAIFSLFSLLFLVPFFIDPAWCVQLCPSLNRITFGPTYKVITITE